MIKNMTIRQELKIINDGVKKIEAFKSDPGFSENSPPYLFSTENLINSFDYFDFKDKNVLTVGSSGDHMFDAYLCGAKNVDTFDCNLFQKYVMELKHSMIKKLSYSDFMEYFFGHDQMNKKIIRNIIPSLSESTQYYLQKYYNCTEESEFYHSSPFWASNEYKKGMISYIKSKENYNKLKEILPDSINFMQTDIGNIHEKTNKKYDIIHTSNILKHTGYCLTTPLVNGQVTFRLEVIDKVIRNNLNPNGGKIAFSYIWGTGPDDYGRKITAGLDLTFEQIGQNYPEFEFKMHMFDSVKFITSKDFILVMQHKSKIK